MAETKTIQRPRTIFKVWMHDAVFEKVRATAQLKPEFSAKIEKVDTHKDFPSQVQVAFSFECGRTKFYQNFTGLMIAALA